MSETQCIEVNGTRFPHFYDYSWLWQFDIIAEENRIFPYSNPFDYCPNWEDQDEEEVIDISEPSDEFINAVKVFCSEKEIYLADNFWDRHDAYCEILFNIAWMNADEYLHNYTPQFLISLNYKHK